jgi:hypothetical protein
MALTHDEIREILELRAKGYSHRKIADKTSHSDATVGKVIREVTRQVITLADQGLTAEDIEKQLNYPLAFVASVIHVRESLKAAEVTGLETPETGGGQAISAAWEEFKLEQQLIGEKEQLENKIGGLVAGLNDMENRLRQEGLLDDALLKKKQSLVDALTEFALDRLADLQSLEGLSALRAILDDIEKEVDSFYSECRSKLKLVEEWRRMAEQQRHMAEEQRRRQYKLRSDMLFDKHLADVTVPAYVKEEVKRRFRVENEEKADIAADALRRYSIPMVKLGSKNTREFEDQMWQAFFATLDRKGGEYLLKLALEYRYFKRTGELP